MGELRVTVENGKYTYVFESNGKSYALRNGEPWQDMTGNKFVYCLAARIAELEEQLAAPVPTQDTAATGAGEFNSEVLSRVTTYLAQYPEFTPEGDDSADRAFHNIADCIDRLVVRSAQSLATLEKPEKHDNLRDKIGQAISGQLPRPKGRSLNSESSTSLG